MFPKYFPAIQNIITADNCVYVITWGSKNGHTECLIFDLEWKLKKKVYIALIKGSEDIFNPWPYTIHQGKLYQLMENEEQWYLQVSPIFK